MPGRSVLTSLVTSSPITKLGSAKKGRVKITPIKRIDFAVFRVFTLSPLSSVLTKKTYALYNNAKLLILMLCSHEGKKFFIKKSKLDHLPFALLPGS
jgi:hypothetical protein